MATINQLIGVKVPASKAFAAVATAKGVSNWWSTTVRGQIAKGKKFDVVFDSNKVGFETTAYVKDKKVTWKCVKDDYGMKGSSVTFDLSRKGAETIVRVSHKGLKLSPFDLAFMTTKWAAFMFSLKDYIEKGKGRPFPKDQQVMHGDF